MQGNDLDNFIELVGKFSTAMLVTRRHAELRSRPMAIGDVAPDGRMRFITRDDSGKLNELQEDDHVNVAMQGDPIFLSVTGHARLTKDPRLVDKAWESKQGPWFAAGGDDPHVIVIEVVPVHAEYWDRSEVGILRLALERARAALGSDGQSYDDDDATLGRHGDVDFRGRPL